ncbi:MAG: adenylate cyclase [Candidatus Azotimanducaceae bacterium]|jgi:adenylate cyclase
MKQQSKFTPACNEYIWSLDPIVDWLFKQGRLEQDQTKFVQALSEKILQAGAPIDLLSIILPTLNPLVRATASTWWKDINKTIPFEATHDIEKTDRYLGSPLQKLFDTQRSVRQSLRELPEDAHRAYTELAEDNFTDYYAMPITFSSGLGSAFIVATKALDGFSPCDIKNLKRLRDYFAPSLEVYSLRSLSTSLMTTYVGKRTGKKVLSGMIRRGDADTINAALWFSDLRNFTHLTETLPAKEVLAMLNVYFEFVSAAVRSRGGEILRFIGDAMLIVFPISSDVSKKSACNAALESAKDARTTLAVINHLRKRKNKPLIEFGVGLNVGEVVYGNVGAPDRLDFTVMGPAVNRTARLESLTKKLGHDVLVSKDFSDQIDCDTISLGLHSMKGIIEPQSVFAVSNTSEHI